MFWIDFVTTWGHDHHDMKMVLIAVEFFVTRLLVNLKVFGCRLRGYFIIVVRCLVVAVCTK